MITFMRYRQNLQSTLSGVLIRWEDQLVHPLGAGVVPRHNILLHISTHEPHLVTCLPKRAHHQRVSVINVKTA